MRNVFLGLMTTISLVACDRPDGPPPISSETERAIIVPVGNANLRVQYDPAVTEGIAYVTYADPVPGIANWLNLNRDVLPAVERATGCRYRGAPLPDNQIMGDMGVGNVPLSC